MIKKKSNNYFSQYMQDRIIDGLLKSKTNGFFIDIGAYDGKTLSNSYFFEISRNYSGLCFEPNPEVFQKLTQNRSCECINAAISDKTEIVKFTKCTGYIEMLSGISKYREEKHIERTSKDISIHGGEICEIEVQAVNLNDILDQRNIREVDFLSLDIEGGEYQVLKAINFNMTRIKIIAVELAFHETEALIRPYLKQHGFFFLYKDGVDGVFINQQVFNILNPNILKYILIDRVFHFLKATAHAAGYRKLSRFMRK